VLHPTDVSQYYWDKYKWGC